MNMAIVQLESTLEDRAQVHKRLAAGLTAMLRTEIMANTRLTQLFVCRPCFERDGEIVPLIEVWDKDRGEHVVICPREGVRRGNLGDDSDIIRKATAENFLATMLPESTNMALVSQSARNAP